MQNFFANFVIILEVCKHLTPIFVTKSILIFNEGSTLTTKNKTIKNSKWGHHGFIVTSILHPQNKTHVNKTINEIKK